MIRIWLKKKVKLSLLLCPYLLFEGKGFYWNSLRSGDWRRLADFVLSPNQDDDLNRFFNRVRFFKLIQDWIPKEFRNRFRVSMQDLSDHGASKQPKNPL